jgi:putative spermidine/putrescine transport system permease protein
MSVFGDNRFQATFSYSLVMALFAIIVGVLIVVPAAYWVRLKLPWLRPVIEFITLLPLIIPPSSSCSATSGCTTRRAPAADRDDLRHRHAADLRLCHARPALHVPGGRHGLRTIDVHTLTEAARASARAGRIMAR